jgi:hypothetical protein
MKTTHLTDRKPNKRCRATAWSRIYTPESGKGFHRLFRRSDMTGKWFADSKGFTPDDDRRAIANALRRMRVKLRDRVDAYDLELMGVTQ